jgi:hypothetical protein
MTNFLLSFLFQVSSAILAAVAIAVGGFVIEEVHASRTEREKFWSEHKALMHTLSVVEKFGGIEEILQDCELGMSDLISIKRNFAKLARLLIRRGVISLDDLNFESLGENPESDKINLRQSKIADFQEEAEER